MTLCKEKRENAYYDYYIYLFIVTNELPLSVNNKKIMIYFLVVNVTIRLE